MSHPERDPQPDLQPADEPPDVPGPETLAQVAALGPFFAVRTHRATAVAGPPWRPMSELVEDPAALMDRVLAVRAYLAAAGGRSPDAVELRVAASVTHLGLTARLVSPALALAVLHGSWPGLDLHALRWQPVLGGAFPLSLADEAFASGAPGRLLGGPVGALVEATRLLSVSPRVLWGNVASAVNGAATALAAASPAHAQRTRVLTALLLAQPQLRDAHTRVAGTTRFRRRSCCLIYRASPGASGALCGDCVLVRYR
ncbi:hypothetical protein ABIA33_005735 [Streptacidiphilus sp. MAP12-16]|uniref:(2Fe-2S)-binding protein n=1 Tax=Streptacidiphilus sp. MAP12-16 TaxID=3156300 RepID=UPI003514147E